MANKIEGGKMSQLPVDTQVSGEEYVLLQEGNSNKRVQVKNLGMKNPEAKVSVVQARGASTTDVMSQDAVTKELAQLEKNIGSSGGQLSVTEHMYEETDLLADKNSWESGWLDDSGHITSGWSCLTSPIIDVIPGFTIIKFRTQGGVSKPYPAILGYDSKGKVVRPLYKGDTANKISTLYIPYDIYKIRITIKDYADDSYKKIEFGKELLDKTSSLINNKAELMNDLKDHSVRSLGYKIEGGKAIDKNYTIIDVFNSSVVTVPLTHAEQHDYIFIFPILAKEEIQNYYNYGYFVDEQGLRIPQGDLTAGDLRFWGFYGEIYGGFLNYKKFRKTMGKDASAIVFTVPNHSLDRLNVYFGNYAPFYTDEEHTVNTVTPLMARSCSQNLFLDSGLTSYLGIQNLDGLYEDADYGQGNIRIGIYNYIKDEEDCLMRSLGIKRCVSFQAGEYIMVDKLDIKRQSYQVATSDILSKASQYKVCFIVEIADQESDFLDSLSFRVIEGRTNLSFPFNFEEEKSKYYKYKIKDNFYLICRYLTCKRNMSEDIQSLDAEYYYLKIRIETRDYSHNITFHGGWLFEAAWNRNKLVDYSMPTLDQLRQRDMGYDIYQKLDSLTENGWHGHSILAVGTSYMHPNSQLAEKTAKKLGCILQNNGNVGGRTHIKFGVPGDGSSWTAGLSMTNKELQEAVDGGYPKGEEEGSNGTWMKTLDFGYENLIMKYICDDNGYLPKGMEDIPQNYLHRPEGFPRPDVMIVLDGQNEANITKDEPSTFLDRTTWRGAWNYLLTEIYKVHPMLKVIFLSNPGITDKRGLEGLILYEATKMVAEQWNLPYIDFVTQLGVINDYRKDPDKDENGIGRLTEYKKNWGGNHYHEPCAERMAQILANYLKGFTFDEVKREWIK